MPSTWLDGICSNSYSNPRDSYNRPVNADILDWNENFTITIKVTGKYEFFERILPFFSRISTKDILIVCCQGSKSGKTVSTIFVIYLCLHWNLERINWIYDNELSEIPLKSKEFRASIAMAWKILSDHLTFIWNKCPVDKIKNIHWLWHEKCFS